MDNAHYATIGMDVGGRMMKTCVMAKAGRDPRIVMETMIPTTKDGLARFLSTHDRLISRAACVHAPDLILCALLVEVCVSARKLKSV